MSLQRALAEIRERLGAPNWSEKNVKNFPEQNKELWRCVLESTGDPLLLHFLSALIREYRIPARDPDALARAIQLYSAEHIQFFRERPERFQSAARTVAWGIGDCDDKSIFVAASLRTFRVPARLTILRLVIDGEPTGHVYPEYWSEDQEKWIPLDSVRVFPVGHNPAVIAAERGFLEKIERIGDKEDPGFHA